ncbi:Bug family tripartite tricarboxylate transporter substrate binding protein [Mycobacterium sp. NPDC003449]
MKSRMRCLPALVAASVVVPFAVGCSTNDGAAEGSSSQCLEGETVELVVPYSTGGGYDIYARAIAKPLADALGATVIVQNEPGAGGLVATNKTAVAKPDGTRIQIVNELGALSAELAGAEGVRYDSTKLTWLARVTDEPDVLVARPDGGPTDLKSLAAATDARMVAIGPGSNTYIDALVVSEVVGLANKVIVGFEGSPETLTSLLRGEADLFASSLSSLQTQIGSGDVKPVAVLGNSRHESMPDVPTLAELPGLTDDQKSLLAAHDAIISTGRAIMGPPGMPEPLTTCLSMALQSVLTEESFAKGMAEQGRPIGYLSGADLTGLVTKVVEETPDRYRAILQESYSN